MTEVLIYIGVEEPKLSYAARQVFERILGWRVAITHEKEEAVSSATPVVAYSAEPIGKGFHLIPRDGETMLTDPFSDPLWFTWTLLYSGQVSLGRDEHSRSRTAELLALNKGWLDRPIVDEVALDLGQRIIAALPNVPSIRRNYTHIATLDVDNGFKYLGRPVWRTIGSAARDLLNGRFGELKDRAATLLGSRRDPYDIYDHFRAITTGNADRSITNFLVAPRGEHDHAVGLSSKVMVDRMRATASWAHVGVHPSYRSSERPGLIARERNALAAALGAPIAISRQHFLRFRHPETFLELEQLGIKEDHSLGLHDAIGFRCGTCTPFPFYDFRKDRETDLMLFPFQVMDSAMAYQMKLSPDEAIAAAKRIVDRVKKVRGTFIGVWHERFISDHGAEKGWRRVVEEVIRYAKP